MRVLPICGAAVLVYLVAAARLARSYPIALGFVVLGSCVVILPAAVLVTRRTTWKRGVGAAAVIGAIEGSAGMLLWAALGPPRAYQAYVTSPGTVKLAWIIALACFGALVGLLGAPIGAWLRRSRP